MKKVFTDREGTTLEWEDFRAPNIDGSVYIESRPFIEVSNDVDLSTKAMDNGVLRDITAAEALVISGVSWDSLNQKRVQSLAVIDLKSIRALREGDSVRVNELEAQAQAIRDTFEVPNG